MLDANWITFPPDSTVKMLEVTVTYGNDKTDSLLLTEQEAVTLSEVLHERTKTQRRHGPPHRGAHQERSDPEEGWADNAVTD